MSLLRQSQPETIKYRPVAEARAWLFGLLFAGASVFLGLLRRFDLVGTGTGPVLELVTMLGCLGAAVYIAQLGGFRAEGFATLRSGGLQGQDRPRAGARLTGLILAVLAGVAAIAVSLPGLLAMESGWFGTAGGAVGGGLSSQAAFAGLGVLISPLLAVAALFVLYAAYRPVLSEATQTQLSGWMFMLPALLLMLLWIYLPAVNAFWISLFRDFNYLGNAVFVWFENYQIAFRDPLFIRSLVNTAWYVVGTVPISIALGVFVAILLNENIRGLPLFRLAYFLPYITALTAAAAVWSWIFNPGLGLLNYVLGLENFRWLSNPTGILSMALAPFGIELSGYAAGPSIALVAIMIMSIWSFLGYNVVIFLAGLQSISKEYYEAARIDGANWWHQLRWITWPLLMPTTFFVLIISLIGSLNVFTQILIMTPTGGVLNDTISVVMYLYQKGFRDFDFGYASALAFILFVITLLLTLMQRRLFANRGGSGAKDS